MRTLLSGVHFPLQSSSASCTASRCTVVMLALLLSLVATVEGQTQASCIFNVFQLDTDTSNTATSLGGINDFDTVVGSRFFGGGNVRGLIRFSGGGISYYSAPNGGDTRFTNRNNMVLARGTTSISIRGSLPASYWMARISLQSQDFMRPLFSLESINGIVPSAHMRLAHTHNSMDSSVTATAASLGSTIQEHWERVPRVLTTKELSLVPTSCQAVMIPFIRNTDLSTTMGAGRP